MDASALTLAGPPVQSGGGMIGDTVAIEIPDAVSEQDAGRAIGACEAALGEDRCSPLDDGFGGDFVARVTQSSALELTIELTRAGHNEVAALRVLKFTEEEPEAFRWQSMGVVVAALVLSQTQTDEPPSLDSPDKAATAPEPKKTPASNSAPASAGEPRESGRLHPLAAATEPDVATLDLAPLVASTSAGAGVAAGALLGGALRVKGLLHVVGSGEASFSAADAQNVELRSRSLGASLGLALRVPLARSRLEGELSARGAFQNLRLSATSDAESGEAATSRWGGRAGGAVAWLPARFVGFVVGGDVGLLWPPIDVDVGTPEALRVSALIWGGYLGLRIRLNRL